MFAARASSQAVGHVTLWPVAPAEGGVYSCHVIMIDSRTRYKTFAVFVCEFCEHFAALLWTHLRATERHLPYGITQCYLPPDTGERALT